jgi:hypothetical protein
MGSIEFVLRNEYDNETFELKWGAPIRFLGCAASISPRRRGEKPLRF